MVCSRNLFLGVCMEIYGYSWLLLLHFPLWSYIANFVKVLNHSCRSLLELSYKLHVSLHFCHKKMNMRQSQRVFCNKSGNLSIWQKLYWAATKVVNMYNETRKVWQNTKHKCLWHSNQHRVSLKASRFRCLWMKSSVWADLAVYIVFMFIVSQCSLQNPICQPAWIAGMMMRGDRIPLVSRNESSASMRPCCIPPQTMGKRTTNCKVHSTVTAVERRWLVGCLAVQYFL